ncbi:MAG TPA: hypothetical protein VF008_18030, partial [Niastella sp.]
DHERNPRGTFKPAVLNEAMEQSKNSLLQVNQTASLIFSGIRDEHRDGTLWPRLLSALRRQLKETNHNDVYGLLNLECHDVHTLRKMLRTYGDIEITGLVNRRLHINLSLSKAPKWRTKHMHEFQASIHVIYPDFVRNRLQKEIVYSDVFPTTAYPEELAFEIPVPPRAPAYAVFLKVTGCIDGVPTNGLQSTGMRCVAAGIIAGTPNQKPGLKAATKKKQPKAAKQKTKTTKRGPKRRLTSDKKG